MISRKAASCASASAALSNFKQHLRVLTERFGVPLVERDRLCP